MPGSPQARDIGRALLHKAHALGLGGRPYSETVVWAGKGLLGAPYRAAPLERKGPERLVVGFQAFDCVTFVETALALAVLIFHGRVDLAGYAGILNRIRYRRGRCNGYASRLHYFSDWIRDGERKGLVRDVTALLGGIAYPKAFCALSDRRAEHPALADPETFRRLRITEACCSRRPLCILPKAAFRSWEGKIREGDLIAVATDAPGIDVCHVGIAVRDTWGLRLLHASSSAGKVVLTRGTVGDYLAEKAERTGIIVGRPRAPRRVSDAPARHKDRS